MLMVWFMRNTNLLQNWQKGFTLLELMVVIVIFSMIMAVGGPSFSRMIERNQLQAAASELTMEILKARSEAIKGNDRVRLYRYPNSVYTYVYSTDTLGNQIVKSGGYFEFSNGIFLTGPSFIDFYPNGRAVITGTLKNFELTKPDGEEPKHCVFVNSMGTARAMADKNDDGNCANG